MGPRRYRIVVNGRLSDRFGAAFGGLALRPRERTTALEGELRDQAELFGVLERMRDLGLEVVRLETLPRGDRGD